MIWKSVPGYEYLEASNTGLIRRKVSGLTNNRAGHVYKSTPRVGKLGGIYHTTIIRINGKSKYIKTHRLVCIAFHGKPPKGRNISAHKNGMSLDNRPCNLYWATCVENSQDTVQHGRTRPGEKCTTAKLSNKAVRFIRKSRQGGERATALASKFHAYPVITHEH